MSVVMNAGDRNPFFLEAGAWFTASGACEVLVDRGPTKIRQKIGATEQQVGPFLSDAQILIIATAETTYTVHPAEAWVPASLVPGQIGDLSGITVADYTELRASTSTAKQIEVTGYLGSAVPSGIAGTFVKDTSGSGADNGGTIIVRTDGARYRRVFDGNIQAAWWGVKGDGTSGTVGTDDLAAINTAIEAVEDMGGGVLEFIPGRIYDKSDAIELKQRVNLYASGPCYFRNTVAGKAGFKYSGSVRAYINATNLIARCTAALTGTIAWDLTNVSDSVHDGIGCDSDNGNDGFLEGVRYFSTAGIGAYRNQYFRPVIRTITSASAVGIRLSGTGTGGESANSTRIFGGNVKADSGTVVIIYNADNCFLNGVTLEGTSDVGVSVQGVYAKGNQIIACRLEGMVTTGIRYDADASFNYSQGNTFSSAVTTKVEDLNGTNSWNEQVQISINTIGRGRFEGRNPLDVTYGVVVANMATAGSLGFDCRTQGNDYPQFSVSGNGRTRWGSGSAATDVGFVRSATAVLQMESGTFDMNNKFRVIGSSGPMFLGGAGTPEAAVSAPVGSIFMRTDGGAGTSIYVKETGTGNTGWVGK